MLTRSQLIVKELLNEHFVKLEHSSLLQSTDTNYGFNTRKKYKFIAIIILSLIITNAYIFISKVSLTNVKKPLLNHRLEIPKQQTSSFFDNILSLWLFLCSSALIQHWNASLCFSLLLLVWTSFVSVILVVGRRTKENSGRTQAVVKQLVFLEKERNIQISANRVWRGRS